MVVNGYLARRNLLAWCPVSHRSLGCFDLRRMCESVYIYIYTHDICIHTVNYSCRNECGQSFGLSGDGDTWDLSVLRQAAERCGLSTDSGSSV